MRKVSILILILGLSLTCLGQKKITLDKHDDELVYSVKWLLRSNSGITTSWDMKTKSRLGDKVSVALLKIYTKDEISDPANIKVYLPIIHAAFEYPEGLSAEDKNPKVTLPLLFRLENKTTNPALKKNILAVSEFIKQKTSNQKQ